mgnify:CR=1 FL=1
MEENLNIIIYSSEDGKTKLDVKLENETLWLNQKQLCELFGKSKSTISEHIKTIFEDEELDEKVVVRNYRTTTQHGAIEEKTQSTDVKYYNLDMIISVGYRVKSQNGILFRKWATSVLKDYMLKGYAVNQKRLEYLEKTIKLIDIANRIDERLEGNDAKEILKVMHEEQLERCKYFLADKGYDDTKIIEYLKEKDIHTLSIHEQVIRLREL